MPETAEINGPEEDSVEFEVVYEGPDVDDGSIATRDLINALSGTSDTFARIAGEYETLPSYSLRVRDIEPGSVEILFKVIEFAKANPGAAAALAAGGSVLVTAATNSIAGFYRVLSDFAKLIDVKKLLRGGRLDTTQTRFEDRTVVLTLPDGSEIELTKEQYELLLSRRVDASLSKLVSPLVLGKVQALELRRKGKPLTRVSVPEKDYFDYVEVAEDKSREGSEIEGTLNSLSKSNLRGTFYTKQGVHVPYRYTGGDMGQLIRGFAARETVRVFGKVKFDTEGAPTSIEIENIEPIQSSLLG